MTAITYPFIDIELPNDIFRGLKTKDTYIRIISLSIKKNLAPVSIPVGCIVDRKECFIQPMLKKRITEIGCDHGMSFDEAFTGLTLAGLELLKAQRKEIEKYKSEFNSESKVPKKESVEINISIPEINLFDNQKKDIDSILNSFKRDYLSSVEKGKERLAFEKVANKIEEKIVTFKKGHIQLSECRKHSEKSFRVGVEVQNSLDYGSQMIRFYLPSSLFLKIGRNKYCPQWIFEEARKKSTCSKEDFSLNELIWTGKKEWIEAHISQFIKVDNLEIEK